MNNYSLKREIPIWFTLFVAVVTLLTISLNMFNGRFWLSDFKVYYSAAQQLLAGGDVYLQSFDGGSGYYKYSPVILYFFLPYCLLTYKTAAIIHFFFLGITYWVTFIVLRDLYKKHISGASLKNEQLLLILSFTCILIHFSREMHLGNINIVMLLFSSLALRNYLDGKNNTGGLFLGLVILTKPFFLILLIPLVLRRRWKSIRGLAVVLITGILLPFLYPGPVKGLALYSDWFQTMISHNTDFPGMNSVFYLLQHYFFPSLPGYAEYFIILATSCLACGLILFNLKHEQRVGENNGNTRNIMLEWFLLIAVLPNMLKTDWVQFVLSAPLITFMIFYIAGRKKCFLIPIFVFVLFFFSANSDDLLGRQLSRKLLEMGMMGLSNMVLLAIALIMFLKERSASEAEKKKRSTQS